jgi:hypothetical protein
MKEAGETERIKAVNGAAAAEWDWVSKELRKVVVSADEETVSAAAAEALGRRGEKSDLRFLLSALRRLKKRPVALAGAVSGIGEYGEPKTAETVFDIGRYWMAKNRYPTQAAIRALGRIRSKEAIDGLIRLYRQTYPSGGSLRGPTGDLSIPGPTGEATRDLLQSYRTYIEAGLRRLTGEDLADLTVWETWWDAHEDRFDPSGITEDPNRSLQLVDGEHGYTIARPAPVWKWIDEPENGFDRTAELAKGGEVAARLSILAYSVLTRNPDNAGDMLASRKDVLLRTLDDVKDPVWNASATVDGEKAKHLEVEGTLGGRRVKIRESVLVHEKTLYLIRVTLDGWATREEKESAKDFEESFTFVN